MPNEKSTNTKPSALKTRRIVSKETTGTNSVRFPYFEAETMSGDEYRQNSKILFDRAITKKRNPDAMVYHPDLAPTPPFLTEKDKQNMSGRQQLRLIFKPIWRDAKQD
jgi:hypothetical protein